MADQNQNQRWADIDMDDQEDENPQQQPSEAPLRNYHQPESQDQQYRNQRGNYGGNRGYRNDGGDYKKYDRGGKKPYNNNYQRQQQGPSNICQNKLRQLQEFQGDKVPLNFSVHDSKFDAVQNLMKDVKFFDVKEEGKFVNCSVNKEDAEKLINKYQLQLTIDNNNIQFYLFKKREEWTGTYDRQDNKGDYRGNNRGEYRGNNRGENRGEYRGGDQRGDQKYNQGNYENRKQGYQKNYNQDRPQNNFRDNAVQQVAEKSDQQPAELPKFFNSKKQSQEQQTKTDEQVQKEVAILKKEGVIPSSEIINQPQKQEQPQKQDHPQQVQQKVEPEVQKQETPTPLDQQGSQQDERLKLLKG